MRVRAWSVTIGLLAIVGAGVGGMTVDLDHAVFRANDSLSYVEVFASIQRAHLKYVDVGDSAHATFLLTLDVLQDSSVEFSDTFRAVDVVPKGERPARGQFFPHVFRFIMKPGVYRLRASLIQNASDLRDVTADTVLVRVFTHDDLSLSDVELGCRMEPSLASSGFVKNGILVLPNPTRFFGTDLPMFYFYAEVYGLRYDSSAADSFLVTHRILDADGKLARPESQRVRPVAGSSLVVADGFPVSTLRTGTYELEVTVKDLKNGQSVQTRKKFWTYRPAEFQAGQQPYTSPEFEAQRLNPVVDALDIIDPDSAVMLMKYVLNNNQRKQVRRLNTEGRRKFVLDFWRGKEIEDPGAANRYFARIAEANGRWNYLHQQGWKTDRGRIFVTYGEPDLIDRNYAAPGITDSEVWHYDKLHGGVIFVFAETRGFGDLDLVHSTMPGEIYDPEWPTTLQRTPGRMRYKSVGEP